MAPAFTWIYSVSTTRFSRVEEEEEEEEEEEVHLAQELLLGPDHAPRAAADPDEGDGLPGREVLHVVAGDEHARPAEPGLAVDRDAPVSFSPTCRNLCRVQVSDVGQLGPSVHLDTDLRAPAWTIRAGHPHGTRTRARGGGGGAGGGGGRGLDGAGAGPGGRAAGDAPAAGAGRPGERAARAVPVERGGPAGHPGGGACLTPRDQSLSGLAGGTRGIEGSCRRPHTPLSPAHAPSGITPEATPL